MLSDILDNSTNKIFYRECYLKLIMLKIIDKYVLYTKNNSYITNINQDRQYLERLEHIDFQPIFILGLHRSGISISYNKCKS